MFLVLQIIRIKIFLFFILLHCTIITFSQYGVVDVNDLSFFPKIIKNEKLLWSGRLEPQYDRES